MGGARVEWRAKVELFEQIRREYEFGCGTIKGVARKFGIGAGFAKRSRTPCLRNVGLANGRVRV
jgi:hypothetical protein